MAKYDFEALKAKVDIVKVISHYIDVTKKGNGYAALCPFHNDSNPSLSISPSKQIFNCFVCHTGGDAFSFVSKYKKIPYLNAVKEACDICGVPTDIKIGDNFSSDSKNTPIYNALEDLAKYYEVYLTSANAIDGKRYIQERHLPEDIVKKFRIGFAPIDPELSIKMMREKKNHSIETLQKSGVLLGGGQFKDRFFGRIIFPITNSYGKVVGFSGRRIKKNDESKYVNSPESVVFHKGNLLYNYYESKELAQKLNKIYVVEGFMDVIALTRCNLPAVGTMGTALTENQINLLNNLKVTICLSLDSDNPGQQAMIKISSELAKRKIKHQIVGVLKDGKDPDEILNTLGENTLIEKMNNLEEPVIHFAKFYKDNNLLDTYDQKLSFVQTFKQHLLNIDQIILPSILKDLSPLLELKEEAVLEYLKENKETISEDNFVPEYDNAVYTEADYIPPDENYLPSEEEYYPEIPKYSPKNNTNKSTYSNYKSKNLNCADVIYSILTKYDTRKSIIKNNILQKKESFLINYIRSSRDACNYIVKNLNDTSFYYEFVNRFVNIAFSFYDKHPNSTYIELTSLDEFQNKYKTIYKNDRAIDEIIQVFKDYSDKNDYQEPDVNQLKKFVNEYIQIKTQFNQLTKLLQEKEKK